MIKLFIAKKQKDRKIDQNRNVLRVLIAVALIAIFSLSILMLSACNKKEEDTSVTREPLVYNGVITELVYGNPVISVIGGVEMRMTGDKNYYFKAEGGGQYQWFIFNYESDFYATNIGDNFNYNKDRHTPVFSINDNKARVPK